MSPQSSGRCSDEALKCGLLAHRPDACAGSANAVRQTPPDGCPKCKLEDYDRTLCLLCGVPFSGWARHDPD